MYQYLHRERKPLITCQEILYLWSYSSMHFLDKKCKHTADNMSRSRFSLGTFHSFSASNPITNLVHFSFTPFYFHSYLNAYIQAHIYYLKSFSCFQLAFTSLVLSFRLCSKTISKMQPPNYLFDLLIYK